MTLSGRLMDTFFTGKHIATPFRKSFIPDKELPSKGLGPNPQFRLSTTLDLPAMPGRNAPFPSRNRGSSPLNRNLHFCV